jgi:hypothetical protein
MKLVKGSAAAKAYMAKIRAKRKKISGVKETNKIKKAAKKLKVTLPHGYATSKGKVRVSGVKKAAKKRASSHKDTKSHNVRISVMSGNIFNFSADELKFLQTEAKKSKGYKYRGKILFGQPIVLKETKMGTPVQKWYVDNLETASALSKELNTGYKLSKVKSKKI